MKNLFTFKQLFKASTTTKQNDTKATNVNDLEDYDLKIHADVDVENDNQNILQSINTKFRGILHLNRKILCSFSIG